MANLDKLYDRLNAGTQYTPLSADTYADWSLEAGDVVTVSKNGTEYQTPVMLGITKWNGMGRVSIESTGKRKRDPLSKQSRDQYRDGIRSGGGYYGGKRSGEDHAWLEDTDEHVRIVAEKTYGSGDYRKIAELKVDPGGIHATVESNRKGVKDAEGRLDLTDRTFDVILEGKGENAKIKAASIMMAINRDQSEVKISADKIVLTGNTTINDILRVTGQAVNIIVPTMIGSANPFNSVGISGGRLVANSINIRGAGGSSQEMNVLDASLSTDGSTLTITRVNGTPINFSKATTLEWAWDSGVRKFTVNAYQKNSGKKTKVGTVSTTLFQTLDNIDWSGGWSAGTGTLRAQVTDAKGKSSTANAGTIKVNAGAAYEAGQRTMPSVVTSTSETPSDATDLGNVLSISAYTKSVVVTIGGNKWYCRVYAT